MFLRVEAEAEVHCHTITSGAASAFQIKANKITTGEYAMCRKFLTINTITLSEISNGSFIQSKNKEIQKRKQKKLTSPTVAMAP